ncbi:MobA/MobL family protein [Aureimonas mangrovi]|uniref:MobA/MobL family protein n=1 Tax=Aureimonas mangrovi TaxID=2758041 RepID=UPI00163DAA1D|nr:MobA/MobL family protein [Aureimonas mangrovi]
MTSLPDHEALCHVRASVIQRSRGKSAVAAAAYRAAARLTDARTGQTWDYSRKRHVTDSFVMLPIGAPDWAQDREALWSRVELAEKRRDAQTARELQVAIPRDLPRDRWGAFLADVAAPYLAAGAAVDVAVHTPKAGDGGEQPHAHLLITTRRFDRQTENGFAATRNAAVAALLTSGGSHGGGARGDALKRERERVATVMNAHLRAAGSRRRADHRSYLARGDPRTPEPPIGEDRKAAASRRRRHDRRTEAVIRQREARKAETELTNLEMHMALTARGFPRTTSSTRQQDYRLGLLRDRYPDSALPTSLAASVYMVDVRDRFRTRVLLRDGSWVEHDPRARLVRTWGPRSDVADALATSLGDDTGHAIERLERRAASRRPGAPRRSAALPEAEAISLADRWRRRGYEAVTESPAGIVVGVGASRIVDRGDSLDVHGPVSDETLRALASKAREDWGGRLALDGPWSQEVTDRLWAECQRQGVTLDGVEPSPAALAAWQAANALAACEADVLRAVRSAALDADDVLAAAAGDVAALGRLPDDLRAFVSGHLDDEQRADLLRADRDEVLSALPAFRRMGADDLARDPTAATLKPTSPTPEAAPAPVAPAPGLTA